MYPFSMAHRLIHKDGNQTREEILPVDITIRNMHGDVVNHCKDGRVFIFFSNTRNGVKLNYTITTEEFEKVIYQKKDAKLVADFLLNNKL